MHYFHINETVFCKTERKRNKENKIFQKLFKCNIQPTSVAFAYNIRIGYIKQFVQHRNG